MMMVVQMLEFPKVVSEQHPLDIMSKQCVLDVPATPEKLDDTDSAYEDY